MKSLLSSLGALVLVCAIPSLTFAQPSPTCTNANPYDNNPDDQALQQCLDGGGTIVLESVVDPGYIIQDTLWVTKNNTILTTTNGYYAFFYAAPNLMNQMLIADGLDGFRMEHMFFDGNKDNRSGRNCHTDSGNPDHGKNLRIQGTGFNLFDVYSVNAYCGSGLETSGSGFEISYSQFSNNGTEVPNGKWADGLTVWGCYGSIIHDNRFQDNTDVDLIIGDSSSCSVWANTITHVARYGVAGFMVASFPGFPRSHPNGWFSDNHVSSLPDLLSFGIMVGVHPWDANTWTDDVGVIESNSSSGAVVNLAIDGIVSGTIRNNTLTGATGSRGFKCPTSAEFTLAHYGTADVSSQAPTPLPLQYDGERCGAP
jgi:hypothetical protein